MELTIDFHVHLNEMKIKPEKMLAQAKKLKLDAIAITEHSEYNPENAFNKIIKANEKYNLTIIPGAELKTTIGHVICLGKNKEFYKEKELFEINVDIKKVIKLSKKNDLIIIIAHPWGYSKDSAGYILGFKKLKKLIKENNIGVEVYNGMIGYLSYFVFDSKLVRIPLKLFEKFEKTKWLKRTAISAISKKMKEKALRERNNLIRRCAAAIDLGKEAPIITAGSDAHYPERIATGITKLKAKNNSIEKIIKALKNKENITWTGPNLKEKKPGIYYKFGKNITKKEIIEGLKYLLSKKTIKRIKLKTRLKNKLKRKEKRISKIKRKEEKKN